MSGQPPPPQGSRSQSGRTPRRSGETAKMPAPKFNDSTELPTKSASGAAYPADLAREVRRRLKDGSKEHGPSTNVLAQLFEVLHFASMRTEEGVPVTCRVTYMDPAQPDLAPPRHARPGRWSATRLAA